MRFGYDWLESILSVFQEKGKKAVKSTPDTCLACVILRDNLRLMLVSSSMSLCAAGSVFVDLVGKATGRVREVRR